MSITILPYLDPTQLHSNINKKQDSSTPIASESFSNTFDHAKKAMKLIAIDAAIAKMKSSGASGISMNSAIAVKLGISDYVSCSDTSTAQSPSTVTSATTASSSANNSILTCSDELNEYFKEASNTYQVDINLLKSIAKAESNFRPDATSHAGAMGIMQLMPATAEELGVSDAYNAHDNIMGGAKLISKLLTKYDGDISLALAAYNAGSGNVDKYGGIPPFTETQNYVKKVLEYYS